MKRIIDIIILTSVLILTGCKDVSSVDPQIGESDRRPIEFGISSDLSVESKAAIDETNYTAAGFTAFGFFTEPDATSGNPVFQDNTVVTYRTDAWSYTPLRYWQPGSYVFAGVMPSGYSATFDSSNKLTLNFDEDGFNLAETQTDLLVAFDKETVTSVKDAGRVDFVFTHQLALVTIEGRSKDPDTQGITVQEIVVYGNSKKTTGDIVFTYNPTSGTFTSAYTPGALSTDKDVYKTISRPGNLTGAAATADWDLAYTDTYDVLEPGLLVFPQTCNFSIVVKYKEGGKDMTMTGTLPATWEAGKKYTYRFSLAADISFSFDVDEWDSEDVSDGDGADEDDEIEIY